MNEMNEWWGGRGGWYLPSRGSEKGENDGV